MGRPQHRCPRLLRTLVFALASCLVLGQDGAQSQKEQAEKDGGVGEPQGRASSFKPPAKRPARDYSTVDPSFTATLEGSMTGGQAQIDAESRLASDAHGRLESLLRDTRTDDCRKEVIDAFQGYMGAQALERTVPFEGQKFTSQCVDANKRPEIPESGLLDPEEVRLAYVLLAHDEPAQVVRLVNALDDTPDKDRTWFIIHIDAKSEDLQQELLEEFKDRPNIIMMDEGRVDVAWGGFNVVQATLNAVALAMERKIPFHWLWILSGTTYPIASNDSIRAKLASHHPESIFMESKVAIHKPASTTWHYFVECDSALHRIGRNLHPRGLDMYVGSQWLAMPPSAARWLMEDTKLVPMYSEYAKHIVVADENFLPTMFKNSPLCGHQVTSNLVHVQFDKYEHTLDREDRRLDKCLMPNPDHCGRSPATMTLDYLSVLEHSGMLFARKFDPRDTGLLDVLDRVRNGEQPWRQGPTFQHVSIRSAAVAPLEASSEGGEGGVDGGQEEELCLLLEDPVRKVKGQRGTTKPEAKMVGCSNADPRQVFKLGPCSSDGHLELGEGGKGFMQSTRGNVSERAPSCSFTSGRGTCLDLLGEAKGPGAPAIGYKCHNRWNQFFSFGEGDLAGHLISTVPSHLAMADDVAGGTVCLEVVEEGDKDTVLRTAACSTESAAQKFNVVQLHAKDDPAAEEAPKKNGKPALDGGECTGPEGTCPAK